jgi:N-acetylated-alpha-linked acidic dipeptidase
MNLSWRRIGSTALFGAVLCSSAAISGGAQDTGGIPGFTPSRVAIERQLENKVRSIPDAAHAESNLRRITSEPHMAGTEANHRLAEWLRDQYRSFGFDAEIVSYSVWMPQPREVKLELTKPEQKTLASPEEPVDGDKESSDKRAVMGFNAYSPSGEVTAPVVYVNYGAPEDYRQLADLGISVEGKVVIARYGKNYRGIKAKIAEEHKAAGLIVYSDPKDDGFVAGEPFPKGPWRPKSGIQRGSIIYTQLYPGDPLTPGAAATPGAKRLTPASAANLPHIPTMPINSQDASAILTNLSGPQVPASWQGGLPFSYHIGPGDAEVHMKIAMDYQQRPVYDVIAKLHGTSDGEWVVLGNHYDAWVFGAADPGSGTASMLETARALGSLARSGWKPRRTIVMCEWDAEEFGLIGSTEWVEANRAELQAKAAVYVNTDVGVNGLNFAASATPSLDDFVRDATRSVENPGAHRSVYDEWAESAAKEKNDLSGTARDPARTDASGKAPLSALGSGSDYSPFFDYAGIPSIDVGFSGPYGVYHSTYDDFFWMKHFGDPTFEYHATLARILGTITLRLDEADILPFDYSTYATEIEHRATDRITHNASDANQNTLAPILDAAAKLTTSAWNASQAIRAISNAPIDPATAAQINRALTSVEQAFLDPQGMYGRPWFKHVIYAPGSYAGYAAVVLPGVSEALEKHDSVAVRREGEALEAALTRASARLDEVTRLAQSTAPANASGH